MLSVFVMLTAYFILLISGSFDRTVRDKVPFISFGRKKLPWYLEPIRNWLLDVVVKFVLYAIRTSESEGTVLTVAEAEYFFKRDKASRQLIGKLLPYIKPSFGEIDELRPLLLQAIQAYDLFTCAAVLLVMICQFERHGENLADLYTELLYVGLQKLPESSSMSVIILSSLSLHIRITGKYDTWKFRKMLESFVVIFDVNEFTYTFPTGRKLQMVPISDQAVNCSKYYGRLAQSELFCYLFNKVKTPENTHTIVNMISGPMGGALGLGNVDGESQVALEFIGQFLDNEDVLVQNAIKDAFSLIRIYYPDDVDDFLAERDRLTLLADILHRKTTENAYLLIQQKGFAFLVNGIIKSPAMRNQFVIPLARSLVDEKSFADWVRVSFLHLVNLMYGDSEPEQ
jgi:hypothetical protein